MYTVHKNTRERKKERKKERDRDREKEGEKIKDTKRVRLPSHVAT